MLKALVIKNYALIEMLELDFSSGFSVITGETGSGKSILMGALSLLQGIRADTTVLRNQADKCIIEGVFHLDDHDLTGLFNQLGLDYDSETIIRREISATGKSRAFINDTPVKLDDLKELSFHLIDIHSQHQTLLLANKKFQFGLIDLDKATKELREDYLAKFRSWQHSRAQLSQLLEQKIMLLKEQDYVQFQIDELSVLELEKTDFESLQAELDQLNAGEDVLNLVHVFDDVLYGQNGLIGQLNSIRNTFQKLKLNLASQLDLRLEGVIIELEDACSDWKRYGDRMELSEERLTWVAEKVDQLNKAFRKYNLTDQKELHDYYKGLIGKIKDLTALDENILSLEKKVSLDFQSVLSTGVALRELRQNNVNILTELVHDLLSKMAMKEARIIVDFIPLKEPTSNGLDDISFLVQTNKGAAIAPLNKVASGGELSRIMLAFKTVLSKNNRIATVIFDEIDTGVSGEIADAMGNIMTKLSENCQVISITHLPQIAGKGSSHYKVKKRTDDAFTFTEIVLLSREERILEIAQMLSGKSVSDAALKNAKLLMVNG